MEPEPPPPLLLADVIRSVMAKLEKVTTQLKAAEERADDRDARDRQRGFWQIVTIVGLILDVILTIVITFVLFHQGDQANQLGSQDRMQAAQTKFIHDSQVKSCLISNQFRDGFKFAIDLTIRGQPFPPGLTPLQKETAQAERNLDIQYFNIPLTHIDCNKLYGLPKGEGFLP